MGFNSAFKGLTESEMNRITRLELCGKNSSHRLSLTKAYTHTATLYNSPPPGGNVKIDRQEVKDMYSVSLQTINVLSQRINARC